jgi:hypothetical protein
MLDVPDMAVTGKPGAAQFVALNKYSLPVHWVPVSEDKNVTAYGTPH